MNWWNCNFTRIYSNFIACIFKANVIHLNLNFVLACNVRCTASAFITILFLNESFQWARNDFFLKIWLYLENNSTRGITLHGTVTGPTNITLKEDIVESVRIYTWILLKFSKYYR
jgi:hypothetical protein